MNLAIVIGVAIIGLLVGLLLIGVGLHKKQINAAFQQAEAETKRIREEARREADELVKQSLRDAKDENRQRRQKFEEEAKNRRQEISKIENKIKQREQTIDNKIAALESREQEANALEDKLKTDEQRYRKLIDESNEAIVKARSTLENIAQMSPEEAKRELVKSLEEEARKEARTRIREIEEQTKMEAADRARSVVSLAVQRVASEFVSDSTISVVTLPSDDMKGRIIGREGRNIRAIEQATGVDLIIDDTPEAVIISCFNPIRREIAKTTLSRLIADGRIHPARIDETAKRVTSEFDDIIRENGEQAAFDVGITDLHPELIKLLGRLRYRTTGVQTVLQHAVETAHICGILAAEMGLNAKRAKRAGILHDVGKAVDQETEGHHAQIGAEICSKFGEADDIATAIRLHHTEDLTHASPLAVILYTANSLSAKRPGARREVIETYLNRLADMENIVKGFEGIDDAYVMQAGNEIRALVSPATVGDDEITDLAQDIASKLRQEMTFPGQVRVTVVRESSFSDFAK